MTSPSQDHHNHEGWAEGGGDQSRRQKAGFLRPKQTAASCLRMQLPPVWDHSSAYHSPHLHDKLLQSNSAFPVWCLNGAFASHSRRIRLEEADLEEKIKRCQACLAQRAQPGSGGCPKAAPCEVPEPPGQG